MKCFWCKRMYEEEKITYLQIREAQYVFNGESQCEQHLDLVRQHGATRVLEEGLMS